MIILDFDENLGNLLRQSLSIVIEMTVKNQKAQFPFGQMKCLDLDCGKVHNYIMCGTILLACILSY